ncbi:hypothetical protein K402DRAFT_44722 [Aulographum hederae CBS 113979]|uniref:Uncharacterized protein n=1 Tax=Aulographum hederae CBS 113979 TaxID=1176131 RepID=A0A6G1H3E7_9PEZI|nr:hypothetical protein K402DRAFT_44722 [Aulographum hederae CBS 113979]
MLLRAKVSGPLSGARSMLPRRFYKRRGVAGRLPDPCTIQYFEKSRGHATCFFFNTGTNEVQEQDPSLAIVRGED